MVTIEREDRKLKANTVLYLQGLELMMEDSSDQKIDLTVRGDFSEGKIIVLNIDGNALNISNADDITIGFDGEPMELSNALDILGAEGEDPKYCITIGDGGTQLLIYISHFSVHRITIERNGISTLSPGSKEILGTLGILAVIAGLSEVLLLTFNVVRVGRRERSVLDDSPGLSGFLRERRNERYGDLPSECYELRFCVLGSEIWFWNGRDDFPV